MGLHNRSLRQDVRELGALLGEVIEGQASRSAFETVEDARTTAIDYRRGDAESRDDLRAVLADLDPDLQRILARAFTTYFELINLAEERERVRATRRGSEAGDMEDSLEAAARDLAETGSETAQRVFEDVFIEPTFTAHPTEARRKTVKAKLRSIANYLETLDERDLTKKEQNQVFEELEAEITCLWATPQLRSGRPDPEDEARNVQWYLENTLFDIVGEVYAELDDALLDVGLDVDVPAVFAFRSWAGSDRDGNPFVTPEVTYHTLSRQRSVVLDRYRGRLQTLINDLSHDGDRIAVGDRFKQSLKADRDRLPNVAATAAERYPSEPYRQKLYLMQTRLSRVDVVRPGGYGESSEFIADLETLAASLRANNADTVARTMVDPVQREAETFGFNLATLDIRDHRANHTLAVREAFDREGIDYESLDEPARCSLLTDAIYQDDPVIDLTATGQVSETASRVLTRFAELKEWQAEFGEAAIDTYCISMTEQPSHVLEVLFLADQAGVVDLPDYCGLDIAPLLETESALSRAREIMGTLFENRAYAAALDARDNVQEVMIGYSDSNKENGFLAANWSLYRNQRRLASIANDYDITLRLFHGRGGSISRGGGPMNEALLALPRETVNGPVKFTEQGEAIAEKYGNPRIGERELEQMLNAQLRARKAAIESPSETIPSGWDHAMRTMADEARAAYQELLETEGFVTYFEEATPITVIEDLNLGSRPASRTGERSVEDLRAIPWVFSWTQSRCILPGWYGLGFGTDAYCAGEGDIETLQEMYDDWVFYRSILDNAAMALARTDMEIAKEYADLAAEDRRERFYPQLANEYDRAVEYILDITGRDKLVPRDWLQESLDLRNPYVDPLNLLQARLLGQAHRSDKEERTLRLTVKGIAAGMKNTG